MRAPFFLVALSGLASPVLGQEAPPTGLAEMELERSRACVPLIARLDELNVSLAPYATRSQRLIGIAGAIAVEERSIVDSLNVSDPVEAEVHAWFLADEQLAQRFIAEGTDALMDERTAAREAIKETVTNAIQAVQEEVQSIIDADGEIVRQGASCEGAIFVRSAVLEACETESSPICEEAAEPSLDGRFRFVSDVGGLWDVEELRPWTSPTPLQVLPDGQLEGARTVGSARNGNIIVSMAFAPLLQTRDELSPEELQAFRAVNDSVGIQSDHPDIAFTPSIAIRASVPEAVAGESFYVVHFDGPDQADALWTGPSGTGAPVEATVPLSVAHLSRLVRGEELSFTAVRTNEAGENDVAFSIQLTALGQAPAADALLGYMAQQLSTDLTRIVPPSGEPRRQ